MLVNLKKSHVDAFVYMILVLGSMPAYAKLTIASVEAERVFIPPYILFN